MIVSSEGEKLTLAVRAVHWVLHRMTEDPRLAYLIGPGSESFDRLTAAGAAMSGVEVDAFREGVLAKLEIQPVPPIGQAGAVIGAEQLARIARYDDGVHDLDNQDHVDLLVNHFLQRGLDLAEAERDDLSGSLF
eukprot:TRINITY_DN2961_c0_g2_i5.p3 TRINITY_DN2961_c0_g2~~TRINITY_DN2961_c0_g2_i5.p3  ORF type:complete len:134 (+),score=27.98 TRINITY_DN2961_c0_g2_i5:868-1269(+)